jgi:hypothetical protein
MKAFDLIGPLDGERLPPLLVTIGHAARLLDQSKARTWEMILDGRLRTVRIDDKYRVLYSSLLAVIRDAEARLEDLLREEGQQPS